MKELTAGKRKELTAGLRAKEGGVTIAEMVTLLSIPRRTLYDIFDRDKKKFDELVLRAMVLSFENKMAQMTIEHNKRLASIMQAGKNNEGCL